jgi:hypothetical protein
MLLLLVAGITGSGCGGQGGNAAPVPAPPAPPSSPKVEEVKDSEFTFADAALRAQLERYAEAARRLAGKDWEHRTWFRTQDSYVYNSWRRTQPDPIPDTEWHFIQLEAYRATRKTLNTKESNRDPREIQAVGLDVHWKPATTGWRAHLWHRVPHNPLSQDQDSFGFDLQQLLDKGEPAAAAWRFRLAEELEFWQTEKVIDDTRYWIRVEQPHNVPLGRTIPTAEIRSWLDSADSFRAAGEARLQTLKEQLEKQMPSGAAVRSAVLTQRQPNLPPFDSKRRLSEAERKQILEDGLAKLAARRRAFVDHAADMHAALVKAFPLAECLAK